MQCFSIVFILTIATTITQASVMESNAEPGDEFFVEVDSSVISSISHSSSRSSDSQPWTISLELTSKALNNNTSVLMKVQICDIFGICFPPVSYPLIPLDSNSSGLFASVTPPSDHSYIRYKFDVNFTDDNVTISMPKSGYGGRVWSECWFESQEGNSEIRESCEEGVVSTNNIPLDDDSVPFLFLFPTISMIGFTAFVRKKT